MYFKLFIFRIKFYFFSLSEKLEWEKPLINKTPFNEIVLEWFFKKRKLSVYIDEDSIDYFIVNYKTKKIKSYKFFNFKNLIENLK